MSVSPPQMPSSARLENLARAQEMRLERAILRRQMNAPEVGVSDSVQVAVGVITATPTCALTWKVDSFLGAVKGIGPVRVDRFLARARIHPGRRLRSLTDRQKMELVDILMAYAQSRVQEDPA